MFKKKRTNRHYQKVCKNLGIQRISGVLADREFVNGRFFRWLNASKIPFYIRIKSNSKICVFKEHIVVPEWFFKDLNPKASSFLVLL